MAEAAIAAVGLGASVISFVGIAGQILQGCQFVCDYIDDIKDAPSELQQMLLELKNFEAALRGLQTTLDNAKECVDVKPVEEQICRALNFGNAAIQDLRVLVDKHAHNGKRDWWKNFKVAKKKKAFVKYCERLDKAKVDILLVQMNINTVIGLANRTSMHQLIQAQTAISMQSSLTVSTTMITQTEDLPESAAGIVHGDESVSHTVRDDLAAELGPMTAKIVESSVNMALESFISDTQGNQDPREIQSNYPEPMYHHKGALDDQKLIRSDGMRVVHQTTQKRIYNAWLASITIRSTTTKLQEIADGDEDGQQDCVESFQTVFNIDIQPHYFIRARFLAVMSCEGLGAHPLNSDMRIRCYNVVPFNSPIFYACSRGDIATVRRLFASRQASPFDVVPRIEGTPHSLLNEVARMCGTTTRPDRGELFLKSRYTNGDHVKRMTNLLKVLEYLVDQGLDPGEPLKIPVLWRLFQILSDCDVVLIPMVQRTIRLTIERSVQNPFHGPEYSQYRMSGAIDYVTTRSSKDCIGSQEIWPMSDLENAVNDLPSPPARYGPTLSEKAPALLRDPNGLRLRRYLQSFTYTSQELVQLCAEILVDSQYYPMENVSFAIEQRLVQCLQAGMDPQEPVAMKVPRPWHGPYIGHTLYSLCSALGALDVLTSALTCTGRSTFEIAKIFDDSKCIILELELSLLRPTSLYRSLCYATPSSMLRSKAMIFHESYQRSFPGEEMECLSLFDIFGDGGCLRSSRSSGKIISNEELFNECIITDRMEDDCVFIILASTAVQAKIMEELKPFER